MGYLVHINPRFAAARELSEFLARLPECFSASGSTVYAARNHVKLFPDVLFPDGLCVKRFRRPNAPQQVAQLFGKRSKASAAFYNAEELRARGFNTPEVVAYAEERRGPFLGFTYLVTRVTRAEALRRCSEAWQTADGARVMRSFARFMAELHARGVLHHDLNPDNVLLERAAESGVPVFSLIDNNRMTFLPCVPADRICMENITRFTGNMGCFRLVATEYAEARGWGGDALERFVRQKRLHDRRWRRKKLFAHPVKALKKWLQSSSKTPTR